LISWGSSLGLSQVAEDAQPLILDLLGQLAGIDNRLDLSQMSMRLLLLHPHLDVGAAEAPSEHGLGRQRVTGDRNMGQLLPQLV